MPHYINSLDESQKSEAAVRKMHEQTVRLLGKSNYSDDEYLTALQRVAEANADAEADAAVVAAVVGNGLTPAQEARLDGDIIVVLANQLLRSKNIDPDAASYEQTCEALDQAAQVLEDRKAGL